MTFWTGRSVLYSCWELRLFPGGTGGWPEALGHGWPPGVLLLLPPCPCCVAFASLFLECLLFHPLVPDNFFKSLFIGNLFKKAFLTSCHPSKSSKRLHSACCMPRVVLRTAFVLFDAHPPLVRFYRRGNQGTGSWSNCPRWELVRGRARVPTKATGCKVTLLAPVVTWPHVTIVTFYGPSLALAGLPPTTKDDVFSGWVEKLRYLQALEHSRYVEAVVGFPPAVSNSLAAAVRPTCKHLVYSVPSF